jgi:hypothetical protein
MVIRQADPARWIVGGRADPGLVAAELARAADSRAARLLGC